MATPGNPLQFVAMVEPPRGMYATFMDEKGRLKIPTDFQPFFIAMSDKKLFVTSLDRKSALIYPMPVWKANEEIFARSHDDPTLIAKLRFNANKYGSQAAMDAQGRLLFAPELRRGLELEHGSLHIWFDNGFFKVVNEKEFEAQDQEAAKLTPGDFQAGMKTGLLM